MDGSLRWVENVIADLERHIGDLKDRFAACDDGRSTKREERKMLEAMETTLRYAEQYRRRVEREGAN